MLGSVRWNIIIALAGMLLTFLFSIQSNLLLTSLIRSLYSFTVIFLLVFPVRWLIGYIMRMNESSRLSDIRADSDAAEEDAKVKGRHIDLSAPADDEVIARQTNLHASRPDRPAPEFTPLNPPKLARKDSLDHKQMAEAVRHLANE
jgi:hypothetical protein